MNVHTCHKSNIIIAGCDNNNQQHQNPPNIFDQKGNGNSFIESEVCERFLLSFMLRLRLDKYVKNPASANEIKTPQ